MKNIRQVIEKFFESWGHTVFRHPFKALLLIGLLSGALAMQVPKIVVDSREEAYFLKHDPALHEYEVFREQFGKDEYFVIGINPPEVFSQPFLKKLQALHGELEKGVPYLKKITSLVNARHTWGKGDQLIVEDLLEQWPKDEAQMAALKASVLANPLYRNLLVSPDGIFTAIVLKPRLYAKKPEADVLAGFGDGPVGGKTERAPEVLSNAQYGEMVKAIEGILARYKAPDFPVYLSGLPAVSHSLDEGIGKTARVLIPVSYLLTFIALFLMFRRISGVLYPILIVALTTISALGAMPLLGATINNLTVIIPTFLTVVGIADSVHILSIFYQRYAETGDKEGSIAHAMGHSALPVLLTSLTTAAGLASFVTADVRPVLDMGVVSAIGVMLALLYTLVLLPALIAIFPMSKKKILQGKWNQEPLLGLLLRISRFSCRNPGKILAVTLAVIIVSGVGLAQIRFSHNALKWLQQEHPIRRATEIMDQKLGGTVSLEVVIDTGKPNGLHDPDLLRRLEKSAAFVETVSNGDATIGKGWSVETIVKEINRALNENRPDHYSIPDNRQLVAQEFLLFEGTGSDDLEEVVDSDFSKARFTMKAPLRDAILYRGLVQDIKSHFEIAYPDAKVIVTGRMVLLTQMIYNVISTTVKSDLTSLVVITVLVMVLVGGVRIGALSMVPNLVPLLAVMGMMGWLHIPLDMATVLTWSIAVGLVVDDTIHFLHNFRRYYEQSGDPEWAVEQTMKTTGRAMLVTSMVLAAGFYSYLLADMSSTQNFGLIAGTSILLAMVSEFFLTPALMVVTHKKRAFATVEALAPLSSGGTE